MDEIFLSYRHDDAADVTGRINDRLSKHFGQEAIFTDVHKIPPGVDFRIYLDEKIRGCRVLLPVIGKQWLTAQDDQGRPRLEDPEDFVKIEIESALRHDKPIIPLLVHRIKMPPTELLPESIRPLAFRNAMEIRPDPDFENDIDRLLIGLKQHLPESTETPAQEATVNSSAAPEEVTRWTVSKDRYQAIVQVLTLILMASELVAMGLFFASEADELRRIGILVCNLIGLAIMAFGVNRRVAREVVLGLTAAAGPWLLVFLVGAWATILVTAAAVWVLGLLVLKSSPSLPPR